MQAIMIEDSDKGKIAYDSLLVSKLNALKALSNGLALKIVKELARSPASPIDVARRLKIHEQKVYYHIRKLEKAGIIYSIFNERRHGMIAKIYNVVAPVVAAKLFDKGTELKEDPVRQVSKEVLDFFYPLIEDGKLNAKIIVGDPYSHGKYLEEGKEGQHIIDFTILIGSLLKTFDFPHYKLDIEVTKSDLKNNLILIGNAWTNTIIDEFNSDLPIQFDTEKRAIIPRDNPKNIYREPSIGVVVKCQNPMSPGKKILILGGIRTRGIQAASIAVTQYLNILIANKKTEPLVAIVEGCDKDGDNRIDFIKILR